MQGLRAEHHVDERRTFADGRAFLAGHAAADADHQLRILLLEGAPGAQFGEDLLLGFFADRAGIEQNHVGFFGLLRQLKCLLFAQQIGHARAVVLVHLATVSLDEKLLGHGFRRGN
ncbi:hypothetical protein D9M71_582540 [compost metagenome]